MLVLVFGPSCVGKTSAMHGLASSYDFRIIQIETTRAARPFDKGKTSITVDEFDRKKSSNGYFYTHRMYGNSYGVSREEISCALQSSTPHLLDAPLPFRYSIFKSTPHIGIVLLPESKQTLRSQIALANRQERSVSIMREYEQTYLMHGLLSSDDTIRHVINKFGQLGSTIFELHRVICDSQTNEYH